MTEIATPGQLRMSYWRWAMVTVPSIALVGSLMGLLSNSGYSNRWFAALDLPSIVPPGWVFGVAWTILYICMGLALAMVLHARGAKGRGFALLLFKVSPALLSNWLPIESTTWFVIVEGLIRVAIFIAYLSLISLWPDLRRVFEYHAAEHKAINAYEAGDELEPETVQRHSLIHVRCGTSFLLYVMVIAIFVFARIWQAR